MNEKIEIGKINALKVNRVSEECGVIVYAFGHMLVGGKIYR